MADGSCSGSSPLKRLTTHQGQDRSLQQDRLQSHQDQSGLFRRPFLDGQRRDADFVAFTTSNASLPGPGLPSTTPRFNGPGPGVPSSPGHVLPPLLSPPTTASFQPRGASVPGSTAAGWAEAFAHFSRHDLQNSPSAGSTLLPARPAPRNIGPIIPLSGLASPPTAWNFGLAGQIPLHGLGVGASPDPIMAASQRPATDSEFQDAMAAWMANHGMSAGVHPPAVEEDVDKILEALAEDLENGRREGRRELMPTRGLDATVGGTETEALRLDVDAVHQSNHDLNPPMTAASTLTEAVSGRAASTSVGDSSIPTSNVALPEMNEAGAGDTGVQEAARQLLQSVNHEQGDKWRNSRFLALMRDLRDGRKNIVGDEIRNADALYEEPTS